MVPQAQFVFVLCQCGAEAALKRELARVEPGWAPAFQRPGLVTFRTALSPSPELGLDSVFARAWGLSLGMARTVEEVLALAPLGEPLRVHVVERDRFRPDEEPPSVVRGALAAAIEASLREHLAQHVQWGPALDGELVLDVIVAPDEPWLVGLHRQTPGRCPFPGGRYPVAVPAESPSRAYAKLEECIQAFGLPVLRGQHALELGAAPGGAAYALARRGVSVLAVDPAAMAADVLVYVGPEGARVTHLPIPMGALERTAVPAPIDWLLMDVHLAPQVALRSVGRVVRMLEGLRGVIFTIKLNDWAFAERIPDFLAQVSAMGVLAPRARQLASHRQEVAIAGLMAATRGPRAGGRAGSTQRLKRRT